MTTEIIEVTSAPAPKPLPLYRRTYSFDGVNGGQIDVCETSDFQNVKLKIQSPDKCSIEILLDSERFGELSYLKYSMHTRNNLN